MSTVRWNRIAGMCLVGISIGVWFRMRKHIWGFLRLTVTVCDPDAAFHERWYGLLGVVLIVLTAAALGRIGLAAARRKS